MNKSICNFLLFIILLVLAVLFFGCEKPRTMFQSVDTCRCPIFVAESGKTYKGDGPWISDCIQLLDPEADAGTYIKHSPVTWYANGDSVTVIHWYKPGDTTFYNNTK